MDNERYGKLKNKIWGILKEHGNYEYCITHLDGVAMLCAFIGLKRGLDAEICKSAGLLHDVWLYCNMPVSADMHRKHGYTGSELAKEVLTENSGYSEEEIEIICKMIYNHNDKDIVHDEYSEALKDADAFQHYLNDSDYDRKYRYHGRDKKVLNEFIIPQYDITEGAER